MAARLLLLVASACAAKTCNELFEEGVDAYLENRWFDCVESLEAAVGDYREFRRNVVACRAQCLAEAAHAPPLYSSSSDQSLAFYEEKLRATLCLLRCKQDFFKDRSPLARAVDDTFEARKPYEYLHLCYFQRRQLQEAASAAFTFLARNPDDEVMLTNLKYYAALPEVKMEDIRNYEAEEFVAPYIKGMAAYDKQEYESVITFMEESLEKYIEALAECRTYCEGPFDQGWFPDFTSSISNHFAYCLKCKEKCQDKLNLVNGERHDDLLESHYHYLQFSYYKVGNMKKAREAVESYLLFHPDDEVMLKNKRFYSEDKNTLASEESSPRPEAVQYFKILEHEKRLLQFIRNEFKFGSEAEVSSNEIEQSTTEISDFKKYQNDSTSKLFPPPIIKLENNDTIKEKPQSDSYDKGKFIEIVHEKKVIDIDKQFLKERAVSQLIILSSKNITVTKGEAELHGKQRFLAEGFVKESECSKLIQLAEVAGVLGDGYNGKTSPHTSFEKFEGVTLGRAAMMVYFGLVEPEILELYLNISEYGRDYVERYFNLKQKLYFSFTHLVCRTALSNSHNITYMSHSVHADNCNLLKDGNCLREVPAYFWRDFSAIIYLNSDFEGGDFVFVSDSEGKSIQSSVMPSCGRLVAFSAGKENLHGVKGVRRGKRCSLGLWFTFNETYNELERVLAKQVLQQVKEKGDISYQLFEELKKHTDSEIPSVSSEAKAFSLKL